MSMLSLIQNPARVLRRAAAGALVVGAALLSGCASDFTNYDNQKTFASPEKAVNALVDAAKADDVPRLKSIFGDHAELVLSSGDPVADRQNREVFVVAAQQGWKLERLSADARGLVLGYDNWPFPIPIVEDSRGWWFNTEAGWLEVVARRIGRNELATIGSLQAYAIAQREYASESHDGRPAGLYAQRIRSSPGAHDGLFWPVANPSEPASPLGELAAQAAREGYSPNESNEPVPFRGYTYRILTEQGPAAPGGAMSYMTGADMTRGFAMIATPAQYGKSGIMTFMVGPDGVVYESDLGENTAALAAAIASFNPDSRWSVVNN